MRLLPSAVCQRSTNGAEYQPGGRHLRKEYARATGSLDRLRFVQAPPGLILNEYAKSHGAFSGRFNVTPSALRDHMRLESDPSSPILAISPR